MDNPKISIVVPVYNVQEYLHDCIESIINQTFTDFELILVNDGSTDNSGSICDEYAKKNTKIIVHHQDNNGNNAARKVGVQKARGEYVGFVDSDDWIGEDMYAYMYSKITQYHCDLVSIGYTKEFLYKTPRLFRDNIAFGFHDMNSLHKTIFPNLICTDQYFNYGLMPSLCTKLFKTELLRSVLFAVDNIINVGEDAARVYSYLFKITSIYCSDQCLYHYRENRDSITHSFNPKLWEATDLLLHTLEAANKTSTFDFSKQIDFYYINMIERAVCLALFSKTGRITKRIKNIERALSGERQAAIKRFLENRNIPLKKRVILRFIQYNWILPLLIYYKLRNTVLDRSHRIKNK